MGFKQGGHAGYGLRRLTLTADGTPRRTLEYNESKGAVTDKRLRRHEDAVTIIELM